MAVYSVTVLGVPLPLLFLYFLWYSLLGWIMETIYCSIKERRFVFRGFLKGPICPIYGFGVLMMVLVLSRFTQNVFLFYLVATVTMSAWEYFVGWLLEKTTHMKYWDYSDHRFNLEGRICLNTSLFWGGCRPTPPSTGFTRPPSSCSTACPPLDRRCWPLSCWQSP